MTSEAPTCDVVSCSAQATYAVTLSDPPHVYCRTHADGLAVLLRSTHFESLSIRELAARLNEKAGVTADARDVREAAAEAMCRASHTTRWEYDALSQPCGEHQVNAEVLAEAGLLRDALSPVDRTDQTAEENPDHG